MIFRRIDRFIKMITFDDEVLNFKDYRVNIKKKTAVLMVHSLLDNITKKKNNDLSPNTHRRGGAPKQFLKRNSVNILNSNQVNIKELSDAKSTFEFIITALCKCLDLKPK